MFKERKPFFLICETPLHAGSGNDLGIVDLPIQRERHTNFPKIEGSSLKGAIREAFETSCAKVNVGNEETDVKNQEVVNMAFGPEDTNSDAHAGALGLIDARILLFPVKSFKGVFAWVTCPKVVNRLARELEVLGFNIPSVTAGTIANQKMCVDSGNTKIILEEYTFQVSPHPLTGNLADWLANNVFPAGSVYDECRKAIRENLVVLSDDDFETFVTMSTEVITRTKIDNSTGTVAKGALFNEEYLPQESILYSIAMASPVFKKDKGIFRQDGKDEAGLVMEYFTGGLPKMLQVGGNATIGKGIIRTNVMGG